MKQHSLVQAWFPCAFAVLGASAVPACQAGRDAQRERFELMKTRGPEASLTVFPVVMVDMDQANKDVADAVGLLLEKAGMKNIETTDAVFRLPADTEFDQAAAPFGAFVREHPIKTDYALYAEFVGTPKTGPTEIRGVVVDRDGASVWKDRQAGQDAVFKRVKPGCPLTCCLVLTESLCEQLGLSGSAKEDPDAGKMARLWARKSGTPDKAERAAISRRQETLKKAGRAAKIAVFPVLIGSEVDRDGATYLTELLADGRLGTPVVTDAAPHFEIKLGPNEQRYLWDLARAFRDYVRANPPAADYGLYAQYVFTPKRAKVWAVHFVVCDRDGEWVIVDFQNDHHSDFRSVDPKSRKDCGRLVARRFEGYMR